MVNTVFAIRYDWAATSDRAAWAAGVESEHVHQLQDFMDSMSMPVIVGGSDEDNITELKEWAARINAFSGRGG